MSDFTAMLLILALFAFMILCLIPPITRGHQRMDEIVSGVVNGVPASTKYRWLIFYLDYLGFFVICLSLLAVFAIGFFKLATLTDDLTVRQHICAE